MARKLTKPTVKQAQTLLDWLVSLNLPTRVINALRRDLEVVMGQREGGDGRGVLAGFDPARFTGECWQGLIRRGSLRSSIVLVPGKLDRCRH